jgi:phosphoglycerate dehydrogenase-like enzyme
MANAEILVIHPTAETYRAMLAEKFPDFAFTPVVLDPAALDRLPPGTEELLPQADAIFSIGRWATPARLDLCRRLRWFQCLITGVDHLLPVLAGRGITLTNARGIHGPQMAELAALHMLALSRKVPQLVRNQADHHWDRIKPRVLEGRQALILGVGSIAESVARVCKAFGMETVGVSRTPRAIDGFDRVHPREKLMQLVPAADFLIVLLPGSPENRHAIGEAVFRAMKPTACLINISRGGVVDEAALVRALRDGWIAGAGLDVFEKSPLPPDSPLWDLPNLFITPFVGGQSDRYEEKIMSIVEPNLRFFSEGRLEEMVNVVPV